MGILRNTFGYQDLRLDLHIITRNILVRELLTSLSEQMQGIYKH